MVIFDNYLIVILITELFAVHVSPLQIVPLI